MRCFCRSSAAGKGKGSKQRDLNNEDRCRPKPTASAQANDMDPRRKHAEIGVVGSDGDKHVVGQDRGVKKLKSAMLARSTVAI